MVVSIVEKTVTVGGFIVVVMVIPEVDVSFMVEVIPDTVLLIVGPVAVIVEAGIVLVTIIETIEVRVIVDVDGVLVVVLVVLKDVSVLTTILITVVVFEKTVFVVVAVDIEVCVMVEVVTEHAAFVKLEHALETTAGFVIYEVLLPLTEGVPQADTRSVAVGKI